MKKVSMTRKAFVKEHTGLIKTLKTGSNAKRLKEASEQSRELKKYK